MFAPCFGTSMPNPHHWDGSREQTCVQEYVLSLTHHLFPSHYEFFSVSIPHSSELWLFLNWAFLWFGGRIWLFSPRCITATGAITKYFICSFSETWKVKESEVELNATLQILWKVCPTWHRAKSSQLAGEQKVLFSLKDEI